MKHFSGNIAHFCNEFTGWIQYRSTPSIHRIQQDLAKPLFSIIETSIRLTVLQQEGDPQKSLQIPHRRVISFPFLRRHMIRISWLSPVYLAAKEITMLLTELLIFSLKDWFPARTKTLEIVSEPGVPQHTND